MSLSAKHSLVSIKPHLSGGFLQSIGFLSLIVRGIGHDGR